ncbi:hypothetical protein [Streptomyces sp. H27-D2]|uniref:hypothetical protein n=1 Tax=Streptomyces sp. H27-D2 TaxID=3046304 RepID=UPI002DB752F4|nr:hypothetical protein [Streptomyces sp. H27-D2]MEC4018996.1 hypothetical protein [Streptomyces sp. H27-D2]
MSVSSGAGPGARPAADADPSGRLTVFGVLGLRAVRRRETTPGSGCWGPPHDLGGGPLAPALSAVRDDSGRRLLFALRFSALQGQAGPNTREITLLEERSPDGPFGGQTSLGNPEDDADRGRGIGAAKSPRAPLHRERWGEALGLVRMR